MGGSADPVCPSDYLPSDRCSRSPFLRDECWPFCWGQRTKHISYLSSHWMQMHDVTLFNPWDLVWLWGRENRPLWNNWYTSEPTFCIHAATLFDLNETSYTQTIPQIATKTCPNVPLTPTKLTHLWLRIQCRMSTASGSPEGRPGQDSIVRWPEVHLVQLCIHFIGKYSDRRSDEKQILLDVIWNSWFWSSNVIIVIWFNVNCDILWTNVFE